MSNETAISSNTSRLQTVIILTTFLLFAIFAMLILRDHDAYQHSVTGELQFVKNSVTENDWSKIQERTLERYNKYFHESGVYQYVFEAMIPSSSSEFDSVVSAKWNHRLVLNVQVFVYQLIHRIVMIEYWLWLLIPAMTAIVWTGVNTYRSKIYIIGGVRPNVVRLYLKLSWLLLNLFLIYLATPNILGPWAPFAPAAMLILLSMLIMGIVQSFHKGTN